MAQVEKTERPHTKQTIPIDHINMSSHSLPQPTSSVLIIILNQQHANPTALGFRGTSGTHRISNSQILNRLMGHEMTAVDPRHGHLSLRTHVAVPLLNNTTYHHVYIHDVAGLGHLSHRWRNHTKLLDESNAIAPQAEV